MRALTKVGGCSSEHPSRTLLTALNARTRENPDQLSERATATLPRAILHLRFPNFSRFARARGETSGAERNSVAHRRPRVIIIIERRFLRGLLMESRVVVCFGTSSASHEVFLADLRHDGNNEHYEVI